MNLSKIGRNFFQSSGEQIVILVKIISRYATVEANNRDGKEFRLFLQKNECFSISHIGAIGSPLSLNNNSPIKYNFF
jgi:hypothetical protein